MSQTVSIIVPCRNEARYLDGFFSSLAAQEIPAGVILEVLIAEGRSGDGTGHIVENYAKQLPHIRVLDNPRGIVSTGLNLAIREAVGDVIIRMDVHAEYASDYIKCCLDVMKETGAQNVGGPARTRAQGYRQRAISAAYHSAFACGGARFHDTEYEGPVDTVTFGCWKKETLLRLGLFDEELVRNQDDEFNLRLIREGGLIWQSPKIRCWYHPRSSLWKLFRQYAQYGFWKVRVIMKHGRPASWRHLVPAVFVGISGLLALCAPFSTIARSGLIAALGSYTVANLIASLLICIPQRLTLLPIMPVILATYHISYGLGFLSGLFCPTTSFGRRPPALPINPRPHN